VTERRREARGGRRGELKKPTAERSVFRSLPFKRSLSPTDDSRGGFDSNEQPSEKREIGSQQEGTVEEGREVRGPRVVSKLNNSFSPAQGLP